MGYNKCNILLLASLAFLAMVVGLSEGFDYHESDLESEERLWDLYERWRSVYKSTSRSLEGEDDEKQKRFNAFKENVKHVDEVNKMDKPYKLRLNHFADLTLQEFQNLYNNPNLEEEMLKIRAHRNETAAGINLMDENDNNVGIIPDSIDWRTKGAVTPIKYQGTCAACWAFTAIAAVESINLIRTRKQITLSEQQLIDCDWGRKQHGCHGGYPDRAFKYIVTNKGVTTDGNYPYQEKAGTCQKNLIKAPIVSIDSYVNVPQGEAALMKAVAIQPVAVTVDASTWDWMLHYTGIYAGPCQGKITHTVLIVGYGTSKDGIDYWIAKNSWSTVWGDDGYIRLQRGVYPKEGMCKIALDASYPVINKNYYAEI